MECNKGFDKFDVIIRFSVLDGSNITVKNIIVFGSGQIGHDALLFLGSENIECFCDNNPSLAGTKKYGKIVISFEELKKFQDAVIVIAVAGYNAYAIAEQCEKTGIADYLIFTFLRETFPDYDQKAFLNLINDPMMRMKVRKDIYLKRSEELERQVAYFRTHADIRHMKPASGELRRRQLKCVQVSAKFLEKISGLGIKPILCSGNLLGYVRHNGFIPWDDDVDFALIRDEFEKLKEYCRLYIYSEYEWNAKEKEVAPGMESYYWVLRHDHFGIVEVLDSGDCIGIDFFPLDYYADDYDLRDLKGWANDLREKLICMDSEEEKIQYIENARKRNDKNIVKESGHIYMGIDNMAIWQECYRDQFIPREVLFPLKAVMWEGEYFWVPNNPEEYLTYEYKQPWDFPKDVGIPLHFNALGEES